MTCHRGEINRPSRACGFTLLEILVAMGILGILAGFAIPHWSSLLSGYRLNAAARQVAVELHSARNRAMAQYRRFKVVFTTSSTYTIQREQAPGLKVYTVISGPKRLPSGITAEANRTPVFQTRGNASPGATITLTNSEGTIKEVVVHLTGRIALR